MATLLDEWQVVLAERFPACEMRRKDIATAFITAPAGADQSGELKIDVFVHELDSYGTNAWRLEEGREVGERQRAHGWISISDASDRKLHFEVTCSPQRFGQVVKEWLSPPSEPASELVIAPSSKDIRKTRKTASSNEPCIERDESAQLLQALPSAGQALAQFEQHLVLVDLSAIEKHWPRDEQGRYLPRMTAVLAAYGPPTRKRQPCLLLTSGALREMPVWRLRLSNEFLSNQRHRWTDAPWMWAAGATEPALDAKARRASDLIAQGRVEDACDLYGVHVSRHVRLLADGLPWQKYLHLKASWPEELRAALRQLAPWRIAAGLAQIQSYLESANKKPPKPGSWERKLFWFSGQTTQVRYGLGVRLAGDRRPELDIIATASNEHFPEVDWKQSASGE